MFKSIYKVLVPAVFLTFTLVACRRDFLDRYPPDKISDPEFWNTPNDLQLFCNNFYQYLPSYRGFQNLGIYSIDDNSDNIASGSRNMRLNGELVVPSNGGGWSTANWTPIRSTDYFLENYEKALKSSSWEEVKPYVGEALFFRAWFYFDKLESFGDLPWINQVLNTDDSLLYYPRLPRNVIVDSIVRDLDNAAAYLNTKSKTPAMRVYKELALAFKSRVCLYEGTWEKYHQADPFGVQGNNGSVFLQQAADAARQVIESGLFKLDNTADPNGYWKLFNQLDYSGSREIMFWRAYSLDLKFTNDWPRYSSTGAFRGITKSLVDAYLCTDAKPISVSPLYPGDDSLEQVIRNRDPRLRQTIYTPGDIITNNKPNGAPPDIFVRPTLNVTGEMQSTTGYEVFKGHNTDYNQQIAQQGTQAQIIMRYAEVLLNYAEAKAELGTVTQEDIDKSINLLRDRVGMPHLEINNITADPNWDFPSLSPLINEIRRERRVELAVEGFRLNDILRWSAADELIAGKQPLGAKWDQWATQFPDLQVGRNIFIGANGYIEPYGNVSNMQNGYQFNVNRDYLLPLPLDELTLNPNVKQNPGW